MKAQRPQSRFQKLSDYTERLLTPALYLLTSQRAFTVRKVFVLALLITLAVVVVRPPILYSPPLSNTSAKIKQNFQRVGDSAREYAVEHNRYPQQEEMNVLVKEINGIDDWTPMPVEKKTEEGFYGRCLQSTDTQLIVVATTKYGESWRLVVDKTGTLMDPGYCDTWTTYAE